MRFITMLAATLAMAACGQPAATDAQAQSGAAAPAAASELAGADRAAFLRAINATLDAQGMLENECGEKVTPRILPVDLGGAVGVAQIFVMDGGPNTISCYGDGSNLQVFKHEGAAWREIYSARGRMIIVLTTSHNGVRDIADGGPGNSFPVWQWDGTTYEVAGRNVPDSVDAVAYLP
ncbi:MAG: hypothetical protein WDM79_09980 [Terricaulis sp.]